ncbi:MAG: LacI family transcriptional regulator [Segetibacter sp.]|nr:LacI family transcriptional regulator [Segetibacter sp.]
MRKKVSLKDIAERVGVSTALVSYVLNNQKTNRIGKDVAQKIRDVALELNYRINHIARSLKTKKTHTIGLLVADISNSFYSTIAKIIEDEAEKNNYTVLFGSLDENAEKSWKLIDALLNHQVDGLIIAPAADTAPQIAYLQENEVPFVLIDRYFTDIDVNSVAINNFKASYSIVDHLIQNGSTRIGIVTFATTLLNLQERTRGYSAALTSNGITSTASWIYKVTLADTKQEVEAAINAMLSLPEPVDAILFTANTLSTFGLKYINTLPLKVPDDLAIASFDESDASELFYAPITHIKQPLAKMAQHATQILLNSINNKKENVTEVLEAELVVRKSSIKKK